MISYEYTKLRKHFGEQPLFCEKGPTMLDSIESSKKEQAAYILRTPQHSAVQISLPQSQHAVNTTQVEVATRGVNHAEGGWPKEINFNDEEQTARYRRRWEREDAYVDAVMNCSPLMEHYIRQNNAIEMYQYYFEEFPQFAEAEESRIRLSAIFRDSLKRPVSSVQWTLEPDNKVAVAYWDTTFPKDGPESITTDKTCYLWNLEKQDGPTDTLTPNAGVWRLIPSPRDYSILAAALSNGRVCVFDVRSGSPPVQTCPAYVAHRDPVSSLLFISSKTMTEIFTGSSDGQCLWWDLRNLSQPFERLTMTVRAIPGEYPTISNSDGVTSLQFDRALPTRFLAGLETGRVVNVNRKGKSLNEIIFAKFNAHSGPVRTVFRNPGIIKMFITCGEYSIKVWSEDIKNDCIIPGTPMKYQIMDVAWAPNRYSCYMCVSKDGNLYYFDLLRKYKEPVVKFPVTKTQELTRVTPHAEGRLIATGGSAGSVSIISVSENLVVSASRDRQLLVQAYEREAHREHLLETRLKEIKLKQREAEVKKPPSEILLSEEEIIKEVQTDYFKTIEDEMKRFKKKDEKQK